MIIDGSRGSFYMKTGDEDWKYIGKLYNAEIQWEGEGQKIEMIDWAAPERSITVEWICDIQDFSFFDMLFMKKQHHFQMASNWHFPPIKSIANREYLSSLEHGDKESIMTYPRILATTELYGPHIRRLKL